MQGVLFCCNAANKTSSLLCDNSINNYCKDCPSANFRQGAGETLVFARKRVSPGTGRSRLISVQKGRKGFTIIPKL